MPISFPKHKSPFDWSPSFYQKVRLQGYNFEHLDYSGVLFYLSSNIAITYLFDALIIKSDLEITGTVIYDSFNPEIASEFLLNQPKSPLKKLPDLYAAYNKLPETRYAIQELNDFRLKVICNTVPGKISLSLASSAIELNLIQIGLSFRLDFYVPYSSVDVDQPDQEYAMIVGTSHIWSAAYLIRNSNILITDANKKVIRKIYSFLFKDANGDRNKLDRIYYWAPDFIINERSDNELLSDLDSLLQGFVDETGTNEEEAVLRMLYSLTSPTRLGNEISAGNKKASEILAKLIDTKKRFKLPPEAVESLEFNSTTDERSIFAALYYKMNDYGGNNNFTAFINQLYALWLLSDWAIVSPYNINYTSEKTLGFYFTNYNFIFYEGEQQIKIFAIGNNSDTARRILLKEERALHVFAPVSITGDAEIDVAEQDAVSSFMPAFYLKGIDDKNAVANLETGIFLAVDIISTFTGFGNLLKFRKLLSVMNMTEGVFTLKKGLVIFKTVVAGIELSSGVIGAMITLSNDCKSSFCNGLRNSLFYLELLSLGADAVVSRLLKKSAQKALDNAPKKSPNVEIDQAQYDEMIKTLEGLAGSKTIDPNALDNVSKNLDSVRLSKLEASEWVKAINRLGGKVRYHTDSRKIQEYFSKNNVGAAFDGKSIPPTIWIRKGEVTDLEMFHEAMHFEDFLRRGKENYLRGGVEELVPLNFGKKTTIPERDFLISKYIKEKYVIDKILEEQEAWIKKYGNGRFTNQEIEFSKKYFEKSVIRKIAKFNTINSGTNNIIDINQILIK